MELELALHLFKSAMPLCYPGEPRGMEYRRMEYRGWPMVGEKHVGLTCP